MGKGRAGRSTKHQCLGPAPHTMRSSPRPQGTGPVCHAWPARVHTGLMRLRIVPVCAHFCRIFAERPCLRELDEHARAAVWLAPSCIDTAGVRGRAPAQGHCQGADRLLGFAPARGHCRRADRQLGRHLSRTWPLFLASARGHVSERIYRDLPMAANVSTASSSHDVGVKK